MDIKAGMGVGVHMGFAVTEIYPVPGVNIHGGHKVVTWSEKVQ